MKTTLYLSLPALLSLFFCSDFSMHGFETHLLCRIFTVTENGLMMRHEYLYDENSFPIMHFTYSNDTIESSETFQYNVIGKIGRIEKTVDVSGPPTHTIQYSYYLIRYGDDGLMERSDCYLKTDTRYELRSFTTFLYDRFGRIIKSTLYTPDSTIAAASDFTYDQSGNIITMDSLRFEYDDKTNPFFFFNLPEVTPRHSSRNNITRWIYPDSSTYEIHYEYDETGYPLKSFENNVESIYDYFGR